MTSASEKAHADEFVVKADGKSYRLALPHFATDYIQGKLATTGEPYEAEMLTAMLEHLSPGDLVLDVGANVGNHTIFLAAVGGCRVMAFEPNGDLTAAISRSVELNGLANDVSVHTVAVGREPGRGQFANHNEANLGGQSVAIDDVGEFEIITLDGLPVEGRVSAIKIDVEGMEPGVLMGATELIRRDRPLLYVECQDLEAFDRVWPLLIDLGYGYAATYNATPTHCFRPTDDGEPDSTRLAVELVRERYELLSQIQKVRGERDDARLKYRNASEVFIRDRKGWVDEKASLARALTNAQVSYERVRGEAVQYRKTGDERASQVARLRARLAAKDRQISGALAREKTALRQKERLDAQVRRMRRSRSARSARVIKRARHSPRQLLMLPWSLLKIWTRPQRAAGSAVDPEQKRSAAESTGVRTTEKPAELATAPLFTSRRLTPEELRVRGSVALRSGERLRTRLAEGRPMRLAAVVDDFTRQCLAEECELTDLTPEGWEPQLEAADPDLLFVESAWRGSRNTWHNAVSRVPEELLAILEWCREHSVPTIFWNKEDPVHFETFLPVAAEFDHVFSTDIDCIGQYAAALGHNRVGFLPFACQPRLQNPVETYPRKDALVFAGGYYTRYPERMRDLRSLIDGASAVLPVEIFDRNLGTTLDDYAFPFEYQKYIVGTLRAHEIDVAYKGYQYALNLNSVKSSQSMFARRAYELLASNTPTISNYAHGLRTLFGEIIPLSDSAEKTEATLRRLTEDGLSTDKLRAMGLRKVLAEHTYSERLRYVVRRVLREPFARTVDVVDVVAMVESATQHAYILDVIRRQAGVEVRATVFVPTDLRKDLHVDKTGRVSLRDIEDLAATALGTMLSEGSVGVAVLDAKSWYGPHYLEDLAAARKYTEVGFLGKACRYAYDDAGLVLEGEGKEYRNATGLRLTAGLCMRGSVPVVTVAEAVTDEGAVLAEVRQFATHRFDYCENGAAAPANMLNELSAELPIDTGAALEEIYASIDAVDLSDNTGALQVVPVSALPRIGSTENDDDVLGSVRADRYRVISSLDDGQRHIVWAAGTASVAAVWPDGKGRVSLSTSGDLSLHVVVRILDGDGEPLVSYTRVAGVAHEFDLPAGAERVQVGLRVTGSGTGFVHRVVLGEWPFDPVIQLGAHKSLVVTDHYPQYDNLYRNAFVHARVRRYLESGLDVGVFRLRDNTRLGYHEFEGVEIATGSAGALQAALRESQSATLVAHFLNPAMWATLEPLTAKHKVVVWIHGAEIQSWHRRAFNFTTDKQIREAKALSEERTKFWLRVFREANSNVHFVFVSRHFAHSVMEDLGYQLGEGRYSVIPNPIETEIFEYIPKDPEQRKRVLSIRPYASRVYANDLAVEAVLALRDESWFGEMEFRFVGDGPLFEETLAPLEGLANVSVERRFLRHAEIAELYRDYGVFLVPTRSDTHGVSRDEAMASGMVPVTNAVAAVPEFVSETEGFLAPPEDHVALAAAIARLYLEPDTFVSKSRAAAERVRRQTAAPVILPRELELL